MDKNTGARRTTSTLNTHRINVCVHVLHVQAWFYYLFLFLSSSRSISLALCVHKQPTQQPCLRTLLCEISEKRPT